MQPTDAVSHDQTLRLAKRIISAAINGDSNAVERDEKTLTLSSVLRLIAEREGGPIVDNRSVVYDEIANGAVPEVFELRGRYYCHASNTDAVAKRLREIAERRKARQRGAVAPASIGVAP